MGGYSLAAGKIENAPEAELVASKPGMNRIMVGRSHKTLNEDEPRATANGHEVHPVG